MTGLNVAAYVVIVAVFVASLITLRVWLRVEKLLLAKLELPRARRQLEAVRALCEQARKVSPSPAMNLYLGDVEQALGLRTEGTRGVVGQRESSDA